ncbi:uncharacterized protein [Solanum lycopersicum]|uniref:uncharacterized protein n=1 Tax=Solanum lycopersicum TaxID=4081 RepID=UPI003748F17D
MDNEVYDRHGHSMKREKYSGQVYSNAPRYEYKKMSNPKPQGKSNEYSHPTYPRCGKIHEGRCLAGRDGCYGCGESGHMKKDFPEAKANMREGNSVDPSYKEDGPPKRNRFYALRSKCDQD